MTNHPTMWRSAVRACIALFAAVLLAAGPLAAVASAADPVTAPAPPPPTLFAVEVTTGPGWDKSRPPTEQAFFREHSAHLKRLRDEGRIVVGARYSDKGLLVFRAASADEVREWMAGDPSMQAGTFTNTVHPFNVFYPGELAAPPRRK